ncbi:MAG: DUF1569 domain-containing protein [bacterium]
MNATATSIDTRKAQRRELAFHCTGCLKSDLAQIEAADRAGTLRVTGNWTAGEILDHVAKTIEFSIDGFPPESRVAWPVRIVARLMKGRMTSGKTLPAGLKLPRESAAFLPKSGTSTADGLARLRRVVERLDAGARCVHPSPAFGAMSHDEWMRLHLAHAQLHFGFMQL